MDESQNVSWLMLTLPARELAAPLNVIVLAWAFWVGATVGSFLNVVIARLPLGESVVTPRSRCPQCKNLIAWYDNIPLVSWLILRAKCRHCSLPISVRYPLVELLVAGLATGIAARFGASLQGLEVLLFAAALVAVAFIDLDTWTIPYPTVFFLLGLGALFGALAYVVDVPMGVVLGLDPRADTDALIRRAIGAAGGFIALNAVRVLATVYFRRAGRIPPDEEAMGLGDPLLLGGIGAVLGWVALPMVVFAAAFQGAVVGIVLKLAGRTHPEGVPIEGDPDEWVPPTDALPFGPFLALGALEVALFGPELLSRWASLVGPGL